MAKLLKDRTARTLARVTKERDLQPRYSNSNTIELAVNTNIKAYIIVLDSPLDPAIDNMDGTWTLTSTSSAKIYNRPDTTNLYSPDPNNAIGMSVLSPAFDLDGATQITRRVFNFSTSTIAANTPIPAIQDVYGDLYLITPGTGGSTPALTGIYYVHDDNVGSLPAPAYGILWNSGSGSVLILGVRFLLATRPNTAFDVHWFVNRGTPVAIGAIGICDMLTEKPGPVRLDDSLIGTINIGDRLGPKPNSSTIWKGYPGFTATGSDYTIGGASVVDCIQHPVERVFGQLYEDLTQNAAGDVSKEFEIWRRDTDGKRKVAGWDKITVYAPLLQKDEKVKKGTFGFADYYSYSTAGTVGWEGDFACDKDDTDSSQSASPGAMQALAEIPANIPAIPDISQPEVQDGTI